MPSQKVYSSSTLLYFLFVRAVTPALTIPQFIFTPYVMPRPTFITFMSTVPDYFSPQDVPPVCRAFMFTVPGRSTPRDVPPVCPTFMFVPPGRTLPQDVPLFAASLLLPLQVPRLLPEAYRRFARTRNERAKPGLVYPSRTVFLPLSHNNSIFWLVIVSSKQ